MIVLRMIKRKWKHIDVEYFRLWGFVRPLLECCVQVWTPYLRQDIDCFVRVQRRVTRVVERLKTQEYKSMLKIHSLMTVETRQQRADLTKIFKLSIIREKINQRRCFSSHKFSPLCDYTPEVVRASSDATWGQRSFAFRAIDMWNI
jgi:hypothetical protein